MTQVPGSRPLSGGSYDYYCCKEDDFLMLSVHVDDQTHRLQRQARNDFTQQLNAKLRRSESGPA
jgi:hypothetical protein